MKVSVEIIYEILIKWSQSKTTKTYTELSSEYHAITNEWFEPHGSWDDPLGKLANVLSVASAPPLTSLVILKGQNEPGGDFWGCAPNVPSRPKKTLTRMNEWMRMVNECYSYNWPISMPLAAV
jgi:hypothetical protein